MSLGLTLRSKTGQRSPDDFYRTPANVTQALMEFLKLDSNTLIWECAAGDGAISAVLRGYGHKVIETDIKTGHNFLFTTRQCDAIITNPPFKHSEAFIRKAVKEVNLVAFLLKSQYWHAEGRLSLFRSFTPAYVLPLTWRPDFTGRKDRSARPTMEVAWTVWIKASVITHYIPLEKPLFQQSINFPI